MRIVLQNRNKYLSRNAIKQKLRYTAVKEIIATPRLANEMIIENYLISKYKITLKQLCFLLIDKACIDITDHNEIIIYFLQGSKYEYLANLITYGNGKFYGSDILKNAFH